MTGRSKSTVRGGISAITVRTTPQKKKKKKTKKHPESRSAEEGTMAINLFKTGNSLVGEV